MPETVAYCWQISIILPVPQPASRMEMAPEGLSFRMVESTNSCNTLYHQKLDSRVYIRWYSLLSIGPFIVKRSPDRILGFFIVRHKDTPDVFTHHSNSNELNPGINRDDNYYEGIS